MTKLIPVLLVALLVCSCTMQNLSTVLPTLDCVEGFKYKDPKPTSGTVSGTYLLPSLPLGGNSFGGLAQLDGSKELFKAAYDKAREAVGADALIHYTYEVRVDWYIVVGWAHVTCHGTGIKYAD
jgi:hypothetical protein